MSGFCVCETEGYPKLCDAQLDQLCSWNCKEYEQGLRPPLYPVPAIPILVDFFPDRVVIWDMSKATPEAWG